MTNDDDDDEWWPLSAAIAWIAVRQPLRWQQWPEDMVPPRLGPSAYLSNGVRLPEAIKRTLASQDDGIDDALADLAKALKRAAAAGRVKLRGQGPWALDPESETVGEAAASDARPTPIDPSEFEREALQFELAAEAIGPSDGAALLRSFPRWKEVAVKASDMRAGWPDRQKASTASEPVTTAPAPWTTTGDDDLESAAKPPRSGRIRPIADQPTLNAWMVLQVHNWKKVHPPPKPLSENETWRAAREAYEPSSVTRSMVREARKKHAPPEWMKSGRRSGALRRD